LINEKNLARPNLMNKREKCRAIPAKNTQQYQTETTYHVLYRIIA